MVDFTEEEILRWKKIFEKDYGRELTHKEAYEAAFNWIGFWDLMLKEYIRQNPEEYKKLKKLARKKKTIMEIYPYAAKTFIREAEDALERLKSGKDADDINRALITFLNATKHAVHQLKTDFGNKLPDFDKWYAAQKEFMSGDKLCKFFYKLRNRVTKGGKKVLNFKNLEIRISPGQPISIKGPLRIGPDAGVSARVPKGEIYEWRPIKDTLDMKTDWEFLDYPMKDPIKLCERYLSSIDGVVDSFIKRFVVK